MILKTVTLQEANGLLPLVKEHFFRINIMITHLQELRDSLRKKPRKRFVFDNASENILIIKKRRRSKKIRAKSKEIRRLEDHIKKELNDLIKIGAIIRNLAPPHIDFLSQRNHEHICLCWHGGENEVNHWHQLENDSICRQNIEEKCGFGPNMVH